jgi:hypothetical protein
VGGAVQVSFFESAAGESVGEFGTLVRVAKYVEYDLDVFRIIRAKVDPHQLSFLGSCPYAGHRVCYESLIFDIEAIGLIVVDGSATEINLVYLDVIDDTSAPRDQVQWALSP